MHLFGGPSMPTETCHRLEAIRWALVTRQLDRHPVPIDLQERVRGEQCRYFRKPDSNDDWVSSWAPDMFTVDPFELIG